MTINFLKRSLAVALCAALMPASSFAQLLLKAPAPVTLCAAAISAPAITAGNPLAAGFATPALMPVLAATSLTPVVAAVPAALTPVLSAPSAVKPALSIMAAQVVAAKPGSAEAASALNLSYEGTLSAASAEPVPARPSALTSALRPAAATPDNERPTPPSANTPRSGKANIGLIAGIGGAVAVIAIIIGLMVHNGNAKNRVWDQSRAAQEVVKIESAKRSGDAPGLFKLEADARGRQKTAQAADAAKARTLDTFDGLVAARAGTSGNAASTKPEQRPGGQLASTWKNRLADAELASKQAGTIAPLARTLAELRAEVTQENNAAGVYSEDLRKFQTEVPTFGGAMGAQAAKATEELAAFRFETATEQGMAEQYTLAMRQLVSDRLAQSDPAYRTAVDRADRLSVVAAGTLGTLDDLADKIDNDLKTMAAERRAQRDNLAEADRHTADAVTDADGKSRTQDNSQTWRDKAAQNAANAQSAAASAKANIEAFNRDVQGLRRDRTLQAENLDRSLPASASVGQPDWQHGVNRDLLDPWQLDNASKSFTEAEAADARARFGSAKGSVTSVQTAVERNRAEVRAALDAAINRQLEREAKGW